MGQNRFPVVRRSLATSPSRRAVPRGLAAAGLALGPYRSPGAAASKKRRKTLRRNAFGCVAVGGKCQGKDAACCSGICQGKKPKKGERDASRCAAHGACACETGQHIQDVCGGDVDVPCTTSTGNAGTSTGHAPYCSRESYCRACQKDADCQRFRGKDAACILRAGCTQGGTACASPTLSQCQFPGA